jgi:GH15 family glucan-1,4-alpha-glucosidase
VSPGRPAVFLLFCGSNSRPKGITPDEAVPLRQQTEAYWKRWLGQRAARGPFASHLERSLLTVKLMQFGPSGAFVASPTSSLPESIGGSLNWDYRYAWLRDCSILVEALFSLGFDRDAERFLTWLYRVHERHPSKFQIMYRVDGDDPLPESTINGLDGYCSSRPVRVGNAAVHQRQLDVFGELMDAAFVGWRAGRRMTQAGRGTLRAIVEYLLKHWQDEGSGLWEARTRRRRYVYSQVMCWVAFDRALRMDDVLDLDVDRRQAVTLILKQIRHEILTRGFNPKLGSFTQSLDHPELDAAALHVLLSGMLPPDDPRVQSTVDVLQERLMQDGLLFRYAPEQGEFKQRESAFLICSAWLVRALTKLGRRQEAEALLQRIIDTQNDLGLMAEEFDPRSGRMLGNFPQTWSHLSLIRAILELEEHLATGLRWEQEAQWEKQPAT